MLPWKPVLAMPLASVPAAFELFCWEKGLFGTGAVEKSNRLLGGAKLGNDALCDCCCPSPRFELGDPPKDCDPNVKPFCWGWLPFVRFAL